MSNELTTFSAIDEKVLELYAQNMSRKDIALTLDIPLKSVNKVFRKPNVKSKLEEIIEHRELLLKAKHLEILEEITDEMLENSDNYSDLVSRKKDFLDVVTTTNTISKELEKKRMGQTGGNVIVNILNQLSEG